jgi:hypothetical protein
VSCYRTEFVNKGAGLEQVRGGGAGASSNDFRKNEGDDP